MVHVAVAAVGGEGPAALAGLGEVHPVVPSRHPTVEDGLNEALRHTRAPLFLAAAQADDRLDPAGIRALAGALAQAPARVVAAAGITDQVRRDGSLRRVTPVWLSSPQALRVRTRLPTPLLFRTAALRAAGGWRPGEAAWEQRPRRHRALLARLLAAHGGVMPVDAHLGLVALAQPFSHEHEDLHRVALRLLYERVEIIGPAAGPIRGRIAAVTPDLLTLATAGEQVALIPMAAVIGIAPLPGAPRSWP